MLTDVAMPSSQASALDAYGPVGRSEWMDVDWQQHLRWVRVRDRWMNLVDVGEGPVVLMVHGRVPLIFAFRSNRPPRNLVGVAFRHLHEGETSRTACLSIYY